MTTKDHLCLSLRKNDHVIGISSSFSNQNSHEYSNLNLNGNQKCSSILETFQSNKSISTSSNSKKNDYATPIKVFDQIGKNNENPSWNKTDSGNRFSNDSNKFGQNDKTQKHVKNSSKKDSSSTLSLHITSYENFIEAQNESKSVENEEKSDKTLKDKFGKTWKGHRGVFSGSSLKNAFEIPRQQGENDKNEPEIMQFKASQKLTNPDVTAAAAATAIQNYYQNAFLYYQSQMQFQQFQNALQIQNLTQQIQLNQLQQQLHHQNTASRPSSRNRITQRLNKKMYKQINQNFHYGNFGHGNSSGQLDEYGYSRGRDYGGSSFGYGDEHRHRYFDERRRPKYDRFDKSLNGDKRIQQKATRKNRSKSKSPSPSSSPPSSRPRRRSPRRDDSDEEPHRGGGGRGRGIKT